MTTSINGTESMLVGFRFHPTDEELVSHYLRLKMEGKDSQVYVIPEVNVCKCEPWDLPGLSVIKSDDPEWFFFSPKDFKYSNSTRSNRATESGYWKVTGKDRMIKAKGTNNVIGIKKSVVFYLGRVSKGVKTEWVIHEYHPAVTLPHQRAFVLCRLKKKTVENINVTTGNEGEESSHIASDFENQVPEVYNQTEANLESVLQLLHQPQDYEVSSSRLPVFNQLGTSFLDSTVTNGYNGMQFQSDADEQEEDPAVFADSLFVDQPYEEIPHFSDTDTDTTQARYDRYVGTSSLSLFNEHVAPKQYRQVSMVKSGTVSSSNHGQYIEERNYTIRDDLGLDASSVGPAAFKSINCIHRVEASSESSPESPLKIRTFKPQHHQRSHRIVGQTAIPRKFQLKCNSSLKVLSQDKAKEASRHTITVDLPKEKSLTESDKERKTGQGSNAKKRLKSTGDGSAGSDQKGYLIFQETSLLGHKSSSPSVYFVNMLIGMFLFVVVIREVVLYGNWC